MFSKKYVSDDFFEAIKSIRTRTTLSKDLHYMRVTFLLCPSQHFKILLRAQINKV